MPAYDATFFDPAAPLAMVTVRSPTTGNSVDNVAMLIDTGADITILPRVPIEHLVETAERAGRYELEGFDGARSRASAVRLELHFLGKLFRGQFLIVDRSHGILGRKKALTKPGQAPSRGLIQLASTTKPGSQSRFC